jgi:hypothetical protein
LKTKKREQKIAKRSKMCGPGTAADGGNTIEDETYVQFDRVGVASYHFNGPLTVGNLVRDHLANNLFANNNAHPIVNLNAGGGNGNGDQDGNGPTPEAAIDEMEESRSFISYEAAPGNWLLDNGQRPPGRKYFKNACYNPQTRIFTGVIDWRDNPFGGDSSWW